MTCDDVFDRLTSGSRATRDERVAEHLSCCSRCRSLAAAIEPALELFHEAVSESHSRRAPLRTVVALRPRIGLACQWSEPVRWAAAILMCLALAGVLRGWSGGSLHSSSGVVAGMIPVLYTDGEDPHTLGAARRPADLRSPSFGLTTACLKATTNDDTLAALVCCTQCHEVKGGVVPTAAARATHSCRACHNG